jgi:hypothetical protein
MLIITNINPDVIDALKNRGHTENEIENMNHKQAFDEYCNWHGLCGWGPDLRNALMTLQNAGKKT